MSVKCVNYMNFDGIRETVAEHERLCGPPDESISYDLSDMNMVRNCSICDFGGTGSKTIDEIIKIFDDFIVKLQEEVKRLTGEPMKRVCFKEMNIEHSSKEEQKQ